VTPPDDSKHRGIPLLLGLIALALPFLFVTLPPAADLPQHVAQARLLHEVIGTQGSGYEVRVVTPYWTVYVLLSALWAVLPPLQVGRVGRVRTRGTRRLVPDRRGDGDLDLDRTLDRWEVGTPLGAGDLVTRTWTGHRRAVCLAVDTSGSMTGLGVAIAAAAAAGVVLTGDDKLRTGLITFGREVDVVQRPGQRVLRRVPIQQVQHLCLHQRARLRLHAGRGASGGIGAVATGADRHV